MTSSTADMASTAFASCDTKYHVNATNGMQQCACCGHYLQTGNAPTHEEKLLLFVAQQVFNVFLFAHDITENAKQQPAS